MKENAISLLINEIKKSLESGNYLSALIVALTIPDICGKILYPNDRNGQRYKKWFDKYIGDYKNSPIYKNLPECIGWTKMTGDAFYELRCAILHEGSDDIVDIINVNKFNLNFGQTPITEKYCTECTEYFLSDGSIMQSPKITIWDVNVYWLCKKIILSAEFFLKNEVDDLSKLPTIQYNIGIPSIFLSNNNVK